MFQRDYCSANKSVVERRLGAVRDLRVAVSEYTAAERELLEQHLVCRCGAMNSPTLRQIGVDVNGIACCLNCGHGGPVILFQPKEH